MCYLLPLQVYRWPVLSTVFHSYSKGNRTGVLVCLCTQGAVDELVQETPTFLPSDQRASLRVCISTMPCANSCAWCTVIITEVLCVLFPGWEKFHQAGTDTWVISALKAGARMCLCHGWDIYFLHGSYLNVHSHSAPDCSAMLVVLSETNVLTQSQECPPATPPGVDVQYLYIGYRSEDIYFKSWFFSLIVFLCL